MSCFTKRHGADRRHVQHVEHRSHGSRRERLSDAGDPQRQMGVGALNILPVHSQHRGRIFLPFIDEDPKTAEIISKIVLLAEDGKLKDPSILNQINK